MIHSQTQGLDQAAKAAGGDADEGPNGSRLASNSHSSRLEHQSRIDVFENAFRKIKEATGVSDVNEVTAEPSMYAKACVYVSI